MPFQWTLFKTVLFLVLWFPGFISNLFIVRSVHVQMRLEGSLQTANILLAGNSLNNLVLASITFATVLALKLKHCPNHRILVWLLIMWETLSGMQMWGITLICVFYCLKVVPGKGYPALWLRRNFTWVAVALVAVGLVFSLGLSIIDSWREVPKNATFKRPLNESCPHVKLPDALVPLRLSVTVLQHSSVSTLVLYSCAAVVAHLYGHVRKMRGGQPGVGGAKQQGVVWVALTIALLAVEFGCCTAARHVLIILSGDEISDHLIIDISLVSLALCCLVPITLIAGTSSLRESATSCCIKA